MGRRRLDSTSCATSAKAVTPHPTNALPDGTCRGIFVGGEGDLVVRMQDDETDVTFKNVPAGSTYFLGVTAVRDTSTATHIVALY